MQAEAIARSHNCSRPPLALTFTLVFFTRRCICARVARFSLLPAGGVYEDSRKLANFAARTETRDGELDEEEAGVGVVTHTQTHTHTG